jgi:predicted transposase YdaD
VNGVLELADTAGNGYLTFRYSVVRIWKIPVEQLLTGGPGTLPLAPLADLQTVPVESVIRRMDARIRSEMSASEAEILWASTYLLMGLRYSTEVASKLTQGVRGMRESATYQAVLQEGREEGKQMGHMTEAQTLLLRIGTKRFGPPTAAVQRSLDAIENVDRLEQLVERVLDVETWAELIAQ